MDHTSVSARQPGIGLLEAVIGSGFAEALHAGLSRYAPSRDTRREVPAAPTPLLGKGGAGQPAEGGILRPGEADAILLRYELAVPPALDTSDGEILATRSALLRHARRVLARACVTDPVRALSPAAATATDPRADELSGRQAAAASALLLECALLHVLESTERTCESVSVRGRAVVSALRQAVRGEGARSRAAGGVGLGHGWAVDGAEESWLEQRELARYAPERSGAVLAAALRQVELHEAGGPGTAHLAAAKESLREAIAHTRGLIGGPRRDAALPPIRQAIEDLVAQAAPDRARVAVKVTGNEQLLADACRRALLLTVRECLRDSFTHARAGRVVISVRVTRWWAHARVVDDGFELPPGVHEPGQGLRSMAERVQGLGGRLAIDSPVGGGTRVDVHLPLRPRA